jgi:hypothetical protein
MEFITQLPWGWATAGDISPDGSEVIVRGYANASLWSRPVGGDIGDAFAGPATSVQILSEPQGEAIGFDTDGSYYTTSEDLHQPIYYFERVWIPGDANQDGQVDDADATILAANWLTPTDATWSMGDFNDDDAVNEKDATLMSGNYSPGLSGSVSVPEPYLLLLLGLGLSSFVLIRRSKAQ